MAVLFEVHMSLVDQSREGLAHQVATPERSGAPIVAEIAHNDLMGTYSIW